MSAPMTPDREQEIRTEVLAEVVGWLVKKAREHRVKGPQYAKQADVIGRLADKVQRGAVRPDNLLMLPPQGGPEDVVDLRAELVRLRAENDRLGNDLIGANLALWEDGREIDRLQLALKAAQRGRRQLRARLEAFEALELGTPEGRISAKCDDSTHPVWLRDLDDMRGCPWCRVAELEAQAAPRGRERLAAKSMAEAEATHWKRLGMTPPAPVEDPHDSPLHHSYALGRDLPEVTPSCTAPHSPSCSCASGEYRFCGASLGRDEYPFTCNRRVAHQGPCSGDLDEAVSS